MEHYCGHSDSVSIQNYIVYLYERMKIIRWIEDNEDNAAPPASLAAPPASLNCLEGKVVGQN
mgnify:CR=1 FL=1